MNLSAGIAGDDRRRGKYCFPFCGSVMCLKPCYRFAYEVRDGGALCVLFQYAMETAFYFILVLKEW